MEKCGICGKFGSGFKRNEIMNLIMPEDDWFYCKECEFQCAEDAAALDVPRSKEIH